MEVLPPPDPMAEASVLAGVMRYGTEAYVDVADVVRTESFLLAENQAIWTCLCGLLASGQREKVDRPTLLMAASACGLSDYLQRPSTLAHVETVLRVPVELESVRGLALHVRKLDVARELRARHEQAMQALAGVTGGESIDDILRASDSPLSSLLDELSGSVKKGEIRQIAEGARERYRELVKSPRTSVGIPSGFPRFDEAIGGGFRPGCLDLILARQKTGKSSLGNNIALHVAGRVGVPVLYIDTEMTIDEQQDRAAAALSGLFLKKVERGELDRSEQVRLGEALKALDAMPYDHGEVHDLRFDDVLARIRRWVSRRVGFRDDGRCNPCLIVYDYFQILTPKDISKQFAEWQVLGLQAKSLKSLMKSLGASCLAFSQMNREETIRVDRIRDSVTSCWYFKEKEPEEVPPARQGEPRLTHELHYDMSRFGGGLSRENFLHVRTDYRRGWMAEGPTRDEFYQQQGGVLKGVGNGRVTDEPLPEPEATG